MKKSTAKTEKNGPLVHVPRMVAVHSLAPAPYNPQKLPLKKFAALKSLIREVGFAEPIVVQASTLMLIAGHHRIKALKEICIEDGAVVPEVPAIVLDVDDVTAKRLNIAFNKVHGEPDPRLLGELLVQIRDEIEIDEAGVETLGFDDRVEFDKYVRLVEPIEIAPGDIDPLKSFGRQPTLTLEFESAEVRDRVKDVLLERSALEKKRSGDLVADLIARGAKKAKLARLPSKASSKRRVA